jgi:hypothetical protein
VYVCPYGLSLCAPPPSLLTAAAAQDPNVRFRADTKPRGETVPLIFVNIAIIVYELILG